MFSNDYFNHFFHTKGQQMLDVPNVNNIENKYIVHTIILDDLVEVLKQKNLLDGGFIMKIDIEGSELNAFESATRLLDSIHIYAIQMEWAFELYLKKLPITKIENFLNFIYSKGDIISIRYINVFLFY
jgi:hypothetical protein